MLRVPWIVLLTVLLLHLSEASHDCAVLSSNYFSWLNTDGTLVLPASTAGLTAKDEASDSCCGPNCSEPWKALEKTPGCQLCASKQMLVCKGPNVKYLPEPHTLPSQLSLLKLSDVGLIALPPHSFSGLTIDRLIVQNSNLTFMAADSFSSVVSVRVLHLTNNTLDYLPQADSTFMPLVGLRALSLNNNGLRVLSSSKSAKLQDLEYLSLAGNPIYTMDLFFLKNSRLRFFDLRGITFKVKLTEMENGGLSALPKTLTTLDLSRANISVKAIENMLLLLSDKSITTLNLSFLPISKELLIALLPVNRTLKYLSFEGTDMNDVFPLTPKEKTQLTSVPFVSLTELNLKNCKIRELGQSEVLKAFPNLKMLSLSGNAFLHLDLNPFLSLAELSYVDFSVNNINDVLPIRNRTSISLQAMDFSYVHFGVEKDKFKKMFVALPYLKNLSFCSATINIDQVETMVDLMELQFLDLSDTLPGSPNLYLAYIKLFASLTSSLTELIFASNNFDFSSGGTSLFSSISSLKTLDLSNNLIRDLTQNMFGSAMTNLILSHNLITTWYTPVISSRSQLAVLDLSNNQIAYVSDAMVQDFDKLQSLNLNNNPLICNNQVVAMVCSNVKNLTHSLIMVNWQQYDCYDVLSNSYRLFSRPEDCDEYYEEVSTNGNNGEDGDDTDKPTSTPPTHWKSARGPTISWIYLIVGVIILTTALGSIIHAKWWNIRCYVHRYFSLKKARLLRKEGAPLTKPEIHYDVFVSYSDVDRSWVLDYLIPNVEGDGDISVCFHERDFQVGLSILENIMQCMDRSHSLLLIVSSAFVRSKWCQFEMHLAQYRLIETLRDQLVLVLLEDIPRKVRPQTLHHLMMTKTYLVWPQQPAKDDALQLFWKRLKRALKPNYNNMLTL